MVGGKRPHRTCFAARCGNAHISDEKYCLYLLRARCLWKRLRGFTNPRVGKVFRVSSSDFLIQKRGSRVREWVASCVRPSAFVGILSGFDCRVFYVNCRSCKPIRLEMQAVRGLMLRMESGAFMEDSCDFK